jgi:hypothetical protein
MNAYGEKYWSRNRFEGNFVEDKVGTHFPAKLSLRVQVAPFYEIAAKFCCEQGDQGPML